MLNQCLETLRLKTKVRFQLCVPPRREIRETLQQQQQQLLLPPANRNLTLTSQYASEKLLSQNVSESRRKPLRQDVPADCQVAP